MVRICFLILCFISLAFAGEGGGGMVSSGGMIFQDANNPWFLSNTTEVKYCIDIDETSFSQTEETVAPIVRKAIDFWAQEFTKDVIATTQFGVYDLGKQKFIQEACSAKTDLRFLFGYGKLNKDGIDFLKDPRRYLGVSVRETYDEVNLKARGFVFISSDMGDAVSYYNNNDLITGAWKYEKLLTFALIHEMGHVFGIPHNGTGIMSEVFLDQMLNKNSYQRFIDLPIESYIAPERSLRVCDLNPKIRTYFGLTGSVSCLELEQIEGHKWRLFSIEGVQKNELAVVETGNVNLSDMQYKSVGTLRLTSKQKVFSSAETKNASFMYGPFIQEFSMPGTLKLSNSVIPKKIMVRSTADSVVIIGELKGELMNLFNHSSQLSRILFFNGK